MAISKTPDQQPFPLRYTEELQPSVERFSTLPTAQDVKNRYLFGVPLTSALTGQTLTDEAITFWINSAISEIEHTLDLYITPVKFREKHDYNRHDFTWNYNFTKLDHKPILNVEKVELSFTNSDVPGFINFPLEFVHVMTQEGTIQLVPSFGTAYSGFLLSAFSGAQFHALQATGLQDFPGGIRVEYTAGFQQDKIPFMISELVGITAALKVLYILGPILFPHNSVSVSIDSVSQSSGTMGPKFFSDLIAQLTQERDRLLKTAQNYYQRSFLVDYL